MRIAVSGTHGAGKSTLIDEFLRRHPEFSHEPEPYTVMVEDLGEEFSAEPCVEDFRRQLEFNIGRLNQYGTDENVIFERCPADYIAYLLALEKLSRDPDARRLKERSIEVAQRAMQNLDVVVFVRPGDRRYEVPDEEDPELRTTVDIHLETILLDNELDLVDGNHPLVIEAIGSTAERIEALNSVMLALAKNKPTHRGVLM